MKQFLPILILVGSAWSQAGEPPRPAAPQASPSASAQAAGSGAAASAPATSAPAKSPAIAADQENARQARALIDQAIQALGGQAFLAIRDREQQGRSYSFHHGRPSNGGVIFWGFSEYPDKERIELTKERDVTELYVGNRGYEITYKGVHPAEKQDLEDYLRRRRFSLDTMLRNWVNDPGVALLFEGFAIAAQHPSQQVTLINAQNESVTLYFDNDTHLPVKKSFTWRDPVDRQKNVEEEVYENYRVVSGIMAPYNVTRFFNGDMASQRFLNSVTVNQGLDPAMFDPNSGYNPNKPVGKPNDKH
jgi:hypothetical protein